MRSRHQARIPARRDPRIRPRDAGQLTRPRPPPHTGDRFLTSIRPLGYNLTTKTTQISVGGVRGSRAERMADSAIDPMNLIWVMPAQGNGSAFSSREETAPFRVLAGRRFFAQMASPELKGAPTRSDAIPRHS